MDLGRRWCEDSGGEVVEVVVVVEGGWGWLVVVAQEELKTWDGRTAAMNGRNGSSREKPRQQFQEKQTTPRRHKRSALTSQYPFNHCNTDKSPLSAIPVHIVMLVQYAGGGPVLGGQVIISQLPDVENCCTEFPTKVSLRLRYWCCMVSVCSCTSSSLWLSGGLYLYWL